MKRYMIALGVLVLALAACVVLIQGIEAAGPNEARVRVVHAVPSDWTGNVDIWVDSQPLLTNIGYTTVTTYHTLSAGFHQVQVYLSILPITPQISETIYLTGGMDYTVAGVNDGSDITTTSLVDNNLPTNANTVRVVNFVSDTLAIDVTITGTLTSTVISGIPYKWPSSYIPGLGTGEASFEVRPSGGITVLHTFTATLDTGTINTFFIMGLSQPPGSALYPVVEKHTVDARWLRVFLPLVMKGG